MSTELGQKMRAAFEATLPSDREVLDRYDVRHLRARSVARPRRWLGVGAGAGALLAAASILLAWALKAERPVAIGPSLERDLRARRSDETVPPQGEGPSADHAEGAVAAPLPERRTSRRAESARGVASSTVTPAVGSGRPVEQAESGPVAGVQAEADSSWARVTEAMRRRDWSAAGEALAPLLASADLETRDSARLVRIRLELGSTQPGTSEQRLLTELEELSKTGATSSIRASARRLHKSLVEGETKHPAPEAELPVKEEE